MHGVDLRGRIAIVTGSNTGIGLECSRQLLNLGLTKLILAVSDEAKGQAAATGLLEDRGQGIVVEVWKIDLCSYESVCDFAKRTTSLERLDIVILNAGILPTKMELNPTTGHEQSIQVNYLSTVLLAILLLPVAKAKRAAQEHPTRITITSSDASAWTKFKERNENPLLPALDRPGKVDMLDRTWLSKLLGQFFLVELAKHVPLSVAVINASTPGMVYDSEISRESKQTLAGKLAEVIRKPLGYTAEVGARMVVDAAVNHGAGHTGSTSGSRS